MQVWLDGSFVEDGAASISLRDTGLLHAAGVFTTMRSYGGKVFALEAHLRRLRSSCGQLFIPLKHSDAALADAVREILARNQLADARLRLTITRGSARDDPLHGLRLEPTAFVTAAALEPYPAEFYERGMVVQLLDEQKLSPYDMQAGHKTLNYFSRLTALRNANQRGAGEALWFSVHNYLQSGSTSNVFVVTNGKLFTPPTPAEIELLQLAARMKYPKSAVLPGIIRAAVLEIAREIGVEAQLGEVDVNGLLEADEVFLTNSIMKVMPVTRIERHAVGEDRPGAITGRLMEILDQRITSSC